MITLVVNDQGDFVRINIESVDGIACESSSNKITIFKKMRNYSSIDLQFDNNIKYQKAYNKIRERLNDLGVGDEFN